MKHLSILLAAGSMTFALNAGAALVNLPFDDPAQYDENFWLPNAEKDVVWSDSPGRVVKKDLEGGAGYVIYNSHATGGSGGNGGTAPGTQLDKFQNFVIQADFRANSVNNTGNSLGFYVKGSDDLDTGYFAVFRLTDSSTQDAGNADFRVWGPNSNPVTGSLGSTLLASTSFGPTTDYSTGGWYTFRLEVLDVDGTVKLIASILDAATDTQIGETIEYSHSGGTAILGAGQVGIRLGTGGTTGSTAFDNFEIAAIPEPSAGLLSALGLGLCFRRRKAA